MMRRPLVIELAAFVLTGLAVGAARLGLLLELPASAPWLQAASRELLEPVLAALLLLPCWLLVQRGAAAAAPTPLWRLGVAALLGAMLASLLLSLLVRELDWASVGDLHRLGKGLARHTVLEGLSKSLLIFVPALLGFSLFELRARQRLTDAHLQQLLAEQDRLGREALSSRLAALQAQVEPGFLFDSLVEIEQAYERAPGPAGERLERLIQHLRVALPRLRENDSRLAQEAALLESYLAVCADRSGQTFGLQRDWPPALDGAAMPAMLLLPLLQGVLHRHGGQAPLQARLQASRVAEGLHLQLQFDRAGLCGSDAEMLALRERAHALSGPAARLDCRSSAGHTVFDLELSSS